MKPGRQCYGIVKVHPNVCSKRSPDKSLSSMELLSVFTDEQNPPWCKSRIANLQSCKKGILVPTWKEGRTFDWERQKEFFSDENVLNQE